VALATSQGDFALATALGLVLIALALTVNVLLHLLQGRGRAGGA
jgi:ABC-type tungstate transport system substrate-binding protein